MSMTMKELEIEITVMLHALRVDYKIVRLIKGISVQFLIEQFGVIVCGISRSDYKIVDDQIKQSYPNWCVVYITTHDNLLEKKEEAIWALMRSGYIRWIRLKYSRAFTELVVLQGFDRKIINQRLKIWGEKSKYKYWIEENEYAKRQSATYILSIDPSFYDYLPEGK